MDYKKPEVIAQNSSAGSFAAGCPSNDTLRDYQCKECERSS